MKTISIVLAMVFMCVMTAFSQTPQQVQTQDPFEGLSAAQKAQLLAQVEQMRGPVTKESVEKYTQYIELGKAAGLALGEAAKNMGVAVNEFVDTKAGVITVALIGWHVAGKDLITLQKQFVRYVVGFFILIVFFSTWIYFFRRMCVMERIIYYENGKKKEVIYKNAKDMKDEEHVTRALMGVMFFGVIALLWLCMFI